MLSTVQVTFPNSVLIKFLFYFSNICHTQNGQPTMVNSLPLIGSDHNLVILGERVTKVTCHLFFLNINCDEV